ncbi:TIGR02391 family protein [Streptomyces sp. CH-036]|uniref:TIGR02391 family protein n=1 Tax=Streptomyces sp. CH-036 TaxID=3406733 RepID=UPI003C70C671
MDHTYAVETLTGFLGDVKAHRARLNDAMATAEGSWPLPPDDLTLKLIRARQIIVAYSPYALNELDEYSRKLDGYWNLVQQATTEALGLAASADEIAAFLRPASPSIAADALHPWVWEPAAQLWAAGAHRDAVLTAARTVNARLQQKLSRHDIGETDLCMQSFDPKPPSAGKPRFRFDGDRDTPTWKARQEGAKYFSAGAFLGIRNLAAHQETVTWTEQEALEYLASFSVVARWIEECSVETVSTDVTPTAGTNGA